MSRPRLPQPNRKSRIISFRLTAAEYARIAHKATTSNLGVNDLARTLVLSRIKHISIQVNAQCDPALIVQLNHIGHNLNQLVKNAHTFGHISPEVDRLCRIISDLINQAIEKEKT